MNSLRTWFFGAKERRGQESPTVLSATGYFYEWLKIRNRDENFIAHYQEFMDFMARHCRSRGLCGVFLFTTPRSSLYYVCNLWTTKQAYQALFGGPENTESELGRVIRIELGEVAPDHMLLGSRELWQLPVGSMEVRQWNPTNIPIPH